MKVVVAPDSYKDACAAVAAAEAMAAGVRAADAGAAVVLCPIADGGEGFLASLVRAGYVEARSVATVDARMRERSAEIGVSGDGQTAVVELAQAAGLEHLAREERDPLCTSTRGVGLMIRAALEQGVTEVVLGIGGSATNDLGCGCAQALGVRFFDPDGRVIEDVIRGGDLKQIAGLDVSGLDERLRGVRIRVACDVTNPLYGPEGAAAVFGPQKGASPAAVAELDEGLRNVAGVIERELGRSIASLPGSGAAGGMGGGAVAFLGAELVSGADLVLDLAGFDDAVADADLVLTGEGKLDGQSLGGKAVMVVARRARAQRVPTVALVGCVGDRPEAAVDAGLGGYEILAPGLSASESMARTAELLVDAAARVVSRFLKQR
ncbi:glycerate kinase [Mucisphaera calidilacus]|uniref:Glycerate 2-kinase n=1 Tax=Mucisphaera calidilacus TaxID=2527982 RepID=A0A518BUH0_9BACT|nr:glycerate kinase [Mucisphaera calidilacus]QDU70591.1 Glycerate 2-kinase [Mucisphaera calidilacus]